MQAGASARQKAARELNCESNRIDAYQSRNTSTLTCKSLQSTRAPDKNTFSVFNLPIVFLSHCPVFVLILPSQSKVIALIIVTARNERDN